MVWEYINCGWRNAIVIICHTEGGGKPSKAFGGTSMEFRLKMMPSRRRISSFANKNEQVRNILTMNGGYKDRIRKGRKKKKKKGKQYTQTRCTNWILSLVIVSPSGTSGFLDIPEFVIIMRGCRRCSKRWRNLRLVSAVGDVLSSRKVWLISLLPGFFTNCHRGRGAVL